MRITVTFYRGKAYTTTYEFKFGEHPRFEVEDRELLLSAIHRFLRRYAREGGMRVEVRGSGARDYEVKRSAIHGMRRFVRRPDNYIEFERALREFPEVTYGVSLSSMLDQLAVELARRYWVVREVLWLLTAPTSKDALADMIAERVRPVSRKAFDETFARIVHALAAYGIVELSDGRLQVTRRGMRAAVETAHLPRGG